MAKAEPEWDAPDQWEDIKAEGSGLANPNFNRDGLNVLNAAQELAGELGDEFVSTEVLLAAIARGQSDAADLLTKRGATYDAIKGVFPSVRGSKKVTTEDPEGQFQALAKYSTDLTARAREGKIDPVFNGEPMFTVTFVKRED